MVDCTEYKIPILELFNYIINTKLNNNEATRKIYEYVNTHITTDELYNPFNIAKLALQELPNEHHDFEYFTLITNIIQLVNINNIECINDKTCSFLEYEVAKIIIICDYTRFNQITGFVF